MTFELSDANFKLDGFIGEGHAKKGFWVFETDESGDLNAFHFDEKSDAQEFVESVENKCIILGIEYDGGGAYKVKCDFWT